MSSNTVVSFPVTTPATEAAASEAATGRSSEGSSVNNVVRFPDATNQSRRVKRMFSTIVPQNHPYSLSASEIWEALNYGR